MIESPLRLHISPFNADILPAILGPSLLDSASNISFHTIQTFPENNYGYLDLPRMDAEKVKKKINGAILKGKKIKIEEARPQKRRRVEDSTEIMAQNEAIKNETKTKKPKKERNVISGHQLPSDRKVKRGWTEATQNKPKKRQKGETVAPASKYSDKDELLFRTKLPQNRTEGSNTKKETAKMKRSRGDHTVHEFEKSTKQPSFLRQNVGLGIQGNLTYVEERGWINEAGETVEQESQRVSRKREAATAAQIMSNRQPRTSKHSPTHSTSSEEEEEEDSSANEQPEDVSQPRINTSDETSSSGSSSDSESDNSAESEEEETSSVSANNEAASGTVGVHPLEALFKKPKKPASQDVAKPSLEISTSFSFFDEQNEEDVDEAPAVPGTPFTSQDVRARGLRSAAPTPDTAHPSRFNSYGSSGLPGDEPDDDEDDEEVEKKGAHYSTRSASSAKTDVNTPSRKQSDFEKKFWENRGDNNRAWKQRRRTVLKEKRQRENKAKRPKNW